jgi:hypothetical protein
MCQSLKNYRWPVAHDMISQQLPPEAGAKRVKIYKTGVLFTAHNSESIALCKSHLALQITVEIAVV